MTTHSQSASRGRARIDELQAAFPAIPRSIVTKSDVLREGTRYTPDIEEAGAFSFPHSLIWNPTHAWNPHEGPEAGQFVTIPWKFDLQDGTPVVVRFAKQSPYEIRKRDGRFFLLRDGEAIEEVTFEPRADWIFEHTTSGSLMAAVFLSWTRESLLGCALRYCEYTKSGDQCVYCCLDANLKEYRQHGIEYDLAVKPDAAAETYRAAFKEVGRIREVAFTGGSLLNGAKEWERYIALFSQLDHVRRELGAKTSFDACLTPPPDRHLIGQLKAAGVDHIGPNMDCWEERLWPAIVPGKHKFVGRASWLETLQTSVDVFGKGNVYSVFVVGPEMVAPGGFRSHEEGVASWSNGFEWLLKRGIIPSLSQWEVEVGSPWEAATPPPTEYSLQVAQALHEQMESSGAYEFMWHAYYKSGAWSTDADFRRLAHGCGCDNCR